MGGRRSRYPRGQKAFGIVDPRNQKEFVARLCTSARTSWMSITHARDFRCSAGTCDSTQPLILIMAACGGGMTGSAGVVRACHEVSARRALREIAKHGAQADPRTLRRLSSSASAEAGILKGPPFIMVSGEDALRNVGVGDARLRGKEVREGRLFARRL